MPSLSQSTLGRVATALARLYSQDQQASVFFSTDYWRNKLFERGFPDWLRQFVLDKSHNWTVIIPELFEGRVKDRDNYYVGVAVCHAVLRKLAVVAYDDTKNQATKDAIRLSLQLDGFEVAAGALRPIDGPVSVNEEKSRLLAFLKVSKLGRKEVISQHIADAEDLFSQGKHHPAIGEARSALQAILDETIKLAEAKVTNRSGGGFKNQVEFLEKETVFSNDDQPRARRRLPIELFFGKSCNQRLARSGHLRLAQRRVGRTKQLRVFPAVQS
jgi:hypothetical protein